jgi:hypothetical protein
MRRWVPYVFAAVLACGSDGGEQPQTSPTPPVTTGTGTPVSGVIVSFGDDVAPAVQTRVTELLRGSVGDRLQVVGATALPDAKDDTTVLVGLGTTALTRELVSDDAAKAIDAEGFLVRSKRRGPGMLVVGTGSPRKRHPHGNLGVHHAAYAILEEMGFAFLHPLAPSPPVATTVPRDGLDLREVPRWTERTMHIHTMHPLELTDLLQGWGPLGPEDATGFEKQLPEWDRFLEWCVANRQSAVEWFLLYADSWKSFADSPVRIERLKRLVDRAHAFGIDAGLDVPIAFAQQHAFRLLRTQGTLESELAEIDKNLDFVMGSGIDFLGTEAGTSEFTHPDPARMLAWMNEVTRLASDKYDAHVAIKVHASTGQTAVGYKDPETGQDINFNMLPHFADTRLGVLPHTVQHYGLTDPAPTYGNTDFSYIRRFLHREVGSRPVQWYPETAYWVSFDVDVPLFLPLYAERRVADLRMLGLDEEQKREGSSGQRMDGQLIFSSGWEWGYWLNDVVAARAAWNPELGAQSDEESFRKVLAPVLRAFGGAAKEVEDWLVDVVRAEYKLLIHGEVAGKRPADVRMRNGQAYLQGWETWDDVSKLSTDLPVKLPPTQPDKLGLVDMRNPAHGGPGYSAEVAPILAAMETSFAALATRGAELTKKVPTSAKDLMDDLADAAQMTALRAKQVHGLYDYVDDFYNVLDQQTRKRRLAEARAALDAAQLVVAGREKRYRVPAERIAGWRKNPTAYSYGYLWTVHSLHYFWRDEGKAVDAPVFPCYLNIVNPVDVANGEGFGTDTARFFGSVLSNDQSRGCLAEPEKEPAYPQDGLRTRP